MGDVSRLDESVHGHGLCARWRAVHAPPKIKRVYPLPFPSTCATVCATSFVTFVLPRRSLTDVPIALPRPGREVLRRGGRTRPELPALPRHHLPRPQARKHPSQLRRPHQNRGLRLREVVRDDSMDALWYTRLSGSRGECTESASIYPLCMAVPCDCTCQGGVPRQTAASSLRISS